MSAKPRGDRTPRFIFGTWTRDKPSIRSQSGQTAWSDLCLGNVRKERVPMSLGPRHRTRAGMSLGRKVGVGLAVAGTAILLMPAIAGAQTTDPDDVPAAVDTLRQQTNLLWIVIGAVLVIFMQAGSAPGRPGALR